MLLLAVQHSYSYLLLIPCMYIYIIIPCTVSPMLQYKVGLYNCLQTMNSYKVVLMTFMSICDSGPLHLIVVVHVLVCQFVYTTLNQLFCKNTILRAINLICRLELIL